MSRKLVIAVAALVFLFVAGIAITFALWSGGRSEPEIATISYTSKSWSSSSS